jgi:hypothetical protein
MLVKLRVICATYNAVHALSLRLEIYVVLLSQRAADDCYFDIQMKYYHSIILLDSCLHTR